MAILDALDAIGNMDEIIEHSSDSRWMAISNNSSKSEIYLVYEKGGWFGASNASIRAGNIASIDFRELEKPFNDLIESYDGGHLYYDSLPIDLKKVVDLIKKAQVGQGGGVIRVYGKNTTAVLLISRNNKNENGEIVTQVTGRRSVTFVEDDSLSFLEDESVLKKTVDFLNQLPLSGMSLEAIGEIGIVLSPPWKVFFFSSGKEKNFDDVDKVMNRLVIAGLNKKLVKKDLSVAENLKGMMRIAVCKKDLWIEYTAIRPTLLFMKK